MTSEAPATGRARCPQRTAGAGHIQVSLVANQSAATSVEAHTPLKILVPRPRGQSVWCYLSNFGGGLLPGDELDVTLSIGAGATCFLGTQSSTKIFRGGPKGAVINRLSANIDSGATLIYAPDPAQGFADSSYRQTQTFHLADKTSRLVFLDWYSSGRSARGERWAFSEYTSRAEIRVAEKSVFLDSIHLEPSEIISLPECMGRINCVATLAIIHEAAQPLLAEISALPIAKRADALIVASPLPNGVVIRVAGVSVEAVANEIFPHLSFIAPLLGDNPFQRKW